MDMIIYHLLELRQRLLRIVGLFLVLFLLFFYFSSNLLHGLALPLLKTLPHATLIAIDITSPIVIPISLAAHIALLCTLPYALIESWYFVAPGLYQKEQASMAGMIVGSLVLFLMGVLFCFYLVLPFIFYFFVHAMPNDVTFMPDLRHAIDFIVQLLLAFGICFQAPILCLALTKFGVVHIDTLKKIRPYVIVLSFIIGMLLTPPDVVSQVMLAVPLCLLYELGIFLSKKLHSDTVAYAPNDQLHP